MDAKETRGVLMVAAAALLLIGVGVALRLLRRPVVSLPPAGQRVEQRDSIPAEALMKADSLRHLRDLRDDSLYSKKPRRGRKASGSKAAKSRKAGRSGTSPYPRNPLRDSVPTSY